MAPSKKTEKNDSVAVADPAPATAPSEGDAKAPSPTGDKKHRRGSSVSEANVFKPEELAQEKKTVKIAKEVSKLNWKMNTSPATVEEPALLELPLTNPPLKSVTIFFPTGLHVVARNLKKGVTIKDAFKAIHKQFHKKADDELELPVLDDIEWTEYFANDRGNWGAVLVKQKQFQELPKKKKKDNQ